MQPTETNQVLPVVRIGHNVNDPGAIEKDIKDLYNLLVLDVLTTKGRKLAVELQNRQKDIRACHQSMGKVNSVAAGDIDLNNHPELKASLDLAADLGVQIDKQKTVYKKEERDRLINNLSNFVSDLSMENERQTSELSRSQSTIYEAMQLFSKVIQTLHQTKKKMLDNIR